MELSARIEPATSPLPRECSTTELREPKNGAGDKFRTCDINLGRVALYQLSYARTHHIFGGERWIRTTEGIHRQIYSLMPLATRQSHPKKNKLELAIGIEPTTDGLQNRCSTN